MLFGAVGGRRESDFHIGNIGHDIKVGEPDEQWQGARVRYIREK